MAPTAEARSPSVDESDEFKHFIDKLRLFHEKRGTVFDPEPKIGTKRVDLLKLYKRVIGEGGYDAVSDTRTKKLAWRQIGQDFNLGNTNLPALAFNLKTVYYKNLAAYEIVEVHKKEPPPKEILEDVSAKGGNLLNRTLENYHRPLSRDELYTNGVDHEGSDEEERKTPGKMDVEDSGSGSGRRLRQAPPQRVLFQNDLSSSRQSRHHSAMANSPTPSSNTFTSSNSTYGTNNMSQTLAQYEPKHHLPLSLRPITTPAQNPEAFNQSQKLMRDQLLARRYKHPPPQKGMMLPGTGYGGPNIYMRTLRCLESGVLEEQEYALHHLTKISHERGDKYRFDNFPGLAEALIIKVLEASSLFTDIDWTITYDEDVARTDPQALDGLNGTPDIIERLQRARRINVGDRLETELFSRRLVLVNEAGLVLRNMVMLEENCDFLSRLPSIRDLLVVLLNLPHERSTMEIRLYACEIAEQITKYFSTEQNEGLLKSLLAMPETHDRGMIIASVRAIGRIGLQAQHLTPLPGISDHVLRQICNWLLVDDEELRSACLDFLYRYTALVDGVESLLEHTNMDALVGQLCRLLLFGARTDEQKDVAQPPLQRQDNAPQPRVPAEDVPIPRIPLDLIEQLLGYEEPERSSQWLRCCFEEDPVDEITQIALWHAYQLPFAPYANQRPLLPAKDFITNVSATFAHASAQVINTPQPKFVIKGIRPRSAPVDPRGKPYMRCLWQIPDPTQQQRFKAAEEAYNNGQRPAPPSPILKPNMVDCNEFALTPKSLWEHIVTQHLRIVRDSDGAWDFELVEKPDTPVACHWSSCTKYHNEENPVIASPFAIGLHVKTHLPDTSEKAHLRSKHNVVSNGTAGRKPYPDWMHAGFQQPSTKQQILTQILESRTTRWVTHNTAVDERHDAAGLPLVSALVLRNLARNIPRTDAAAQYNDKAARSMASGENTTASTPLKNQAHASSLNGTASGSVTGGYESMDTDQEYYKITESDFEEDEEGEDTSDVEDLLAFDADGKWSEANESLLRRIFAPITMQMFYVFAHNQSLKDYLASLARTIEDGGG